MKVYCDKCNHGFKVMAFERREIEQITDEKVTQIYFACPKCKSEYTTFFETERALEIMAENREIKNRQRGKRALANPKKTEELQQQRNANMKAFQQEQNRIKELLSK